MELSDIREFAKNAFDGVGEQERPTVFGSIIEQIRLGLEDTGASLGPPEVRAFSEQVFQNVDPSTSPDYLVDVIDGVRVGAKDAGIPACGDMPIEPLSHVSYMAERVTAELTEYFWGYFFQDGDVDDIVEQLGDNPIPYHRLIEALPVLEEVIVEHATAHSYLPSDSLIWDHAVPDADSNMAYDIAASLTDWRKSRILDLVREHVNV